MWLVEFWCRNAIYFATSHSNKIMDEQIKGLKTADNAILSQTIEPQTKPFSLPIFPVLDKESRGLTCTSHIWWGSHPGRDCNDTNWGWIPPLRSSLYPQNSPHHASVGHSVLHEGWWSGQGEKQEGSEEEGLHNYDPENKYLHQCYFGWGKGKKRKWLFTTYKPQWKAQISLGIQKPDFKLKLLELIRCTESGTPPQDRVPWLSSLSNPDRVLNPRGTQYIPHAKYFPQSKIVHKCGHYSALEMWKSEGGCTNPTPRFKQ